MNKNHLSKLGDLVNIPKMEFLADSIKAHQRQIEKVVNKIALIDKTSAIQTENFTRTLKDLNLAEIFKDQIPLSLQQIKLVNDSIADTLKIPPSLASVAKEGYTKAIEKLPELVKLIHDEGWYIPLVLLPKDVFELGILIGSEKSVDDAMSKFYSSRLHEYENYISSRHPDRQQIFKQAFHAHKKELFFLSIPVFLAQAEGINTEQEKTKLYRKQSIQKKMKTLAPNSGFSEIISRSFSSSEFAIGSSSYPDSPIEYNRNSIMHGWSLTYGTRTNSLKSISLLILITTMLAILKPKK